MIPSRLTLLATLIAAASIVSGQTASSPATTAPPSASTTAVTTSAPLSSDSDLVKAARTSSAKKKSRLSITDRDVKKSSAGKAPAAAAKASSTPSAAGASSTKSPEKTRLELEERVDKARSNVADLTADVARLEEAFYAADDPDYRDRVVVKAFNQAKEQLETARQELAAAREALDKVDPQPADPSS